MFLEWYVQFPVEKEDSYLTDTTKALVLSIPSYIDNVIKELDNIFK